MEDNTSYKQYLKEYDAYELRAKRIKESRVEEEGTVDYYLNLGFSKENAIKYASWDCKK